MKLSAAADVMRAAKKDEVFTSHLREQTFEVATRVLGPAAAVRLQAELDLLSDVAYHALSSVIPGAQTLGEEYCAIAVAPGTSRLRRVCSLALSTVVPYAVARASSATPQQSPSTARQWATANAKEIVSRAQQAHTALFFVDGRFFELSKRVCGLTMHPTAAQTGQRPTYGILGGLALLRVVLAVAKLTKDFQRTVRATKQPDSKTAAVVEQPAAITAEAMSAPPCTLCLEPRMQPTATPCGHVFCWDCLARALVAKDECPLCRKHVSPASIIRVYNMV